MRHLPLFVTLLLACEPGVASDATTEADGGTVPGAVVETPSTPEPPPIAAPSTSHVEAIPEAPGSPSRDVVSSESTLERPTSILARYDFDEPTRRFALPGRLDEISGLAMTQDGRLFGHDDERGRVHEIDPWTGEVGKRFDLGSDIARDDFEGIAVVGERFFLVSSAGRLYEFREGADEQNMRYRMTDSGLGRGCEIEGLDYDPADDALLFACKTADDDGERIVIRRLSMDPEVGRLPEVHIDRGELDAVDVDEDFEPSALLVLPGGTYLLASATEESLLEVDREGRVLGGVNLENRTHPQPEGLEIGDDGTLYLADEENDEDASLTAYARREGER